MYPQPYGQTQYNYSTNNPPPATRNGQQQQYQPQAAHHYQHGQTGPSGRYPQQPNGQQTFMPQMNDTPGTGNAPSKLPVPIKAMPPPQRMNVHPPPNQPMTSQYQPPPPTMQVETTPLNSQNQTHINPQSHITSGMHSQNNIKVTGYDGTGSCPTCSGPLKTGARDQVPKNLEHSNDASFGVFDYKAIPPESYGKRVRPRVVRGPPSVFNVERPVQYFNQTSVPQVAPHPQNGTTMQHQVPQGQSFYSHQPPSQHQSARKNYVDSQGMVQCPHPMVQKQATMGSPSSTTSYADSAFEEWPQKENIKKKSYFPECKKVFTKIGMLQYEHVIEKEYRCYLPDGSTFTVFGNPEANIAMTIDTMTASDDQFQMRVGQNMQNQVDAYKKSIEELRRNQAIRKKEVDSEPTEILPKNQQQDEYYKDRGTSLSQSRTGFQLNAPQEQAAVAALQEIARTVASPVPAVAADAPTTQAVVPIPPAAVSIDSVLDQKTAHISQKSSESGGKANESLGVRDQQESVAMPVATHEQVLAKKRALKEAEQRLLKQKKAERDQMMKLAKEKKLAEEAEKKQKKEAEAEKRRIENAKRKAQEKFEEEEKIKEEQLLKKQQLKEKKEKQLEAKRRQRANKAERKREAEKKTLEELAELEKRIEANRIEEAARVLENCRIEAERKKREEEEAAAQPVAVSKRQSFDYLVENADKFYDLHPDDLAHLLEERAKAEAVGNKRNMTPPQFDHKTKEDSKEENEEKEEVEIGIDGTLCVPRPRDENAGKNPDENFGENPDENFGENPDENSGENPDENSDENSGENLDENSDENPDENRPEENPEEHQHSDEEWPNDEELGELVDEWDGWLGIRTSEEENVDDETEDVNDEAE